MQTRFIISISVEAKTKTKLDQARGMVPRSRFAEKLIMAALKEKKPPMFPRIKRVEDD